MESEIHTTLCTKCHKNINTYNMLTHQFRCPGKSINSIKPTKSRYSQLIQTEIRCQKCLKDFNHKVFKIHFDNCPNIKSKPKIKILNEEQTYCKQKIEIQQVSCSINNTLSLKNKQRKRQSSEKTQQRIVWLNCIRCNQKVKQRFLDEHTELCISIDKKCQYCDQGYPQYLLNEHIEVCQAKKYLDRIKNQNQQIQAEQKQFYSFEEEINFQNQQKEYGYEQDSYYSEEQNDEEHFSFGDRLVQFGESIYSLYNNLINNQDLHETGALNQKQLKQIKKIKYQRKQEDVDQCSICFTEFNHKQQINQLNCKHLYHIECISKWFQLNSLCPVCKRSARKN